jgi:hypothetical protein
MNNRSWEAAAAAAAVSLLAACLSALSRPVVYCRHSSVGRVYIRAHTLCNSGGGRAHAGPSSSDDSTSRGAPASCIKNPARM